MNKYTRRKINGSDIRLDAGDNVVIENHHQPIIGYRTFVTTRALREKRSRSNYRGVKKYDNVYLRLRSRYFHHSLKKPEKRRILQMYALLMHRYPQRHCSEIRRSP